MNKVILIGRLTRDVETRYSGETAISRYTLAVDRKFKKEGEQTADFINCVAFGNNGVFAEKYLRKGIKIAVTGRIQTGSYTDKDGKKVYTTDIVVEEHEFCESKGSGTNESEQVPTFKPDANGFISIPDGIEEELPFL
jgi:single-strand DNA-binding protein